MKLHLLFILSLLFLLACDSLRYSEVAIDLEEASPQMVLHAFFVDTDSCLWVHLDKSTTYFESDSLVGGFLGDLPGATIELFKANDLIGTLGFVSQEIRRLPEVNTVLNYFDTLPFPLKTYGSSFEIRVKHPDFNEIRANQTFPPIPPVPSIRLVRNAGVDIFGNATDGLLIEFNDAMNAENFYQIYCRGIRKDKAYKNTILIRTSSDDPIFKVEADAFSTNLTMSDESFNGSKFSFSLYFEESTATYDSLLVGWRSISKEWFQYVDSAREQQRLSGFLGNYAEPFNVISNIEGGLGIFGLGREQIYPIKL
ncbi:MAG: DUF4249 family protein [Saprospiraceae bacterium]